ncbi:Site-specific DNA recombinase [Rhizobiales bacterium GAS188]|nr:Site-specific DNA recombinase [Rhizobiales bacterium GAS188]
MRAAIYCRVSTDGQTTENQRLALEEVAARRGFNVVDVYTDQGISGAKGRDKRPAFDKMLKDATRGKFDVVMAWAIDRIGRSVHDVSGFMVEMEALGVKQYYDKQAIDTATPAGKAMLHMCVVFSEFERDMIRERINVGLKRARAQGKRLGRPTIDPKTEQAISAALAQGDLGMLKIAAKFKVGSGTVQRIKAGMAGSAI